MVGRCIWVSSVSAVSTSKKEGRGYLAHLVNEPPALRLDSQWRILPVLLLLAPLPFKHDPYKMLQVEIRPQAVNKEDLRVVIALPEHKVAEPLNAASSNEELERWIGSRVHVLVEHLGCDPLGVGKIRGAAAARA